MVNLLNYASIHASIRQILCYVNETQHVMCHREKTDNLQLQLNFDLVMFKVWNKIEQINRYKALPRLPVGCIIQYELPTLLLLPYFTKKKKKNIKIQLYDLI